MNIDRRLLFLALTFVGVSVPCFSQGPVCSNRLIAGDYSYTCTGMVLLPNATAPVPIAIVGVARGDADGNWSGAATMSLNGVIMPQFATTDPSLGGKPAVVKPDCSGTITYQTYLDPNHTQPLGPLPINFVIMNDGNEIKGLPTNPGYTVTCHLVRQWFRDLSKDPFKDSFRD
jgi:hypothetical protein